MPAFIGIFSTQLVGSLHRETNSCIWTGLIVIYSEIAKLINFYVFVMLMLSASKLQILSVQDGDESTATLMRAKLESAIGSVMHKSQPWFHNDISREEAERRLQVMGLQDGMFLIREKDPGFVLGLAHESAVVHYLFDVDAVGKLSIKSGPKFDNLMLAVDHYTQREDGLLCKLREPCNAELFDGRRRTPSTGNRPPGLFEQRRSPSSSLNDNSPFASNPFLRAGSGTGAMVPDIIREGTDILNVFLCRCTCMLYVKLLLTELHLIIC